MRCSICPAPADVICAGLDVRRYCQLLDASCPEHDPRYAQVIVRESRRAQTHPQTPSVPGPGVVIPSACCTGSLPPGVYER
jgi:hypothetical protein